MNNNEIENGFKGAVIGWRFLPEMPKERKEVLIVFKWFDIPVQAYWDGKTWKASFELRDVMKDGYCNDRESFS